MKIVLTGKLVNVGDRNGTSTPGAVIDLSEESRQNDEDDEDDFVEMLTLELDLKKEHTLALASHLYSDLRITIEPISKPKLVP
jgi:hypothetical protein